MMEEFEAYQRKSPHTGHLRTITASVLTPIALQGFDSEPWSTHHQLFGLAPGQKPTKRQGGAAKAASFSILYGSGPGKLAKMLGPNRAPDGF